MLPARNKVRRQRRSGSDRRSMHATPFGLLAATGMRIAEALVPQTDDVKADGLVVRETKFQRSRLLPRHATVRPEPEKSGEKHRISARTRNASLARITLIPGVRCPSCLDQSRRIQFSVRHCDDHCPARAAWSRLSARAVSVEAESDSQSGRKGGSLGACSPSWGVPIWPGRIRRICVSAWLRR
jgi:hypothetical protein